MYHQFALMVTVLSHEGLKLIETKVTARAYRKLWAPVFAPITVATKATILRRKINRALHADVRHHLDRVDYVPAFQDVAKIEKPTLSEAGRRERGERPN
jgi:hypothetical protein